MAGKFTFSVFNPIMKFECRCIGYRFLLLIIWIQFIYVYMRRPTAGGSSSEKEPMSQAKNLPLECAQGH